VRRRWKGEDEGEMRERIKRRTGVKGEKKERKWTGEGEEVTAQ
jgi:hypothetical protein